MDEMISKIDWLGHASFRIRGSKTIYIDPWKRNGNPKDADIILITHSHYDHFSRPDIDKVAKPDRIMFAPASEKDQIKGRNIKYLKPGENFSYKEIKIEAVRGYNKNKKFHPEGNDWLGYIITIDGVRIYHSGDTDDIDEMANYKCDIALLPVSGTYVMTAEEAIKAVEKIKPKYAIPMHWGEIVGSKADAELFAAKASCQVVIKEKVD